MLLNLTTQCTNLVFGIIRFVLMSQDFGFGFREQCLSNMILILLHLRFCVNQTTGCPVLAKIDGAPLNKPSALMR